MYIKQVNQKNQYLPIIVGHSNWLISKAYKLLILLIGNWHLDEIYEPMTAWCSHSRKWCLVQWRDGPWIETIFVCIGSMRNQSILFRMMVSDFG